MLEMKNRIAVVISDVHYSLATLDLANKAFVAAIDKAAELKVPLIDNGDLTNDKAIVRGEYINLLIKTFKYAQQKNVKIYLNVGNHSLINEKSKEHVLNFLRPFATIIDYPQSIDSFNFVPYQNNSLDLVESLKLFSKNDIIFTHQGFLGAQMGDYIQDKSSIDPALVKDFTVISGHYHRCQTIGTVTYIGSPYTITFGEANDGPKGFLILNEDGSFTREILNLRKHIIKECTLLTLNDPIDDYNQGDLVWIKVTGTRSELENIDKKQLGLKLFGHSNFKLDLYPIEDNRQALEIKHMSDAELLDQIIDNGGEPVDEKLALKSLWRTVLDENT